MKRFFSNFGNKNKEKGKKKVIFIEEGNAQEWLNKNYSKERRQEFKSLDISYKNLTGSLIVNNWPNLKKIFCNNNQLTGLNFNNCSKLAYIVCHYNKLTTLVIDKCPEIVCLNTPNNLLTNLEFLNNLNVKKLTSLSVAKNNFPPHELSFFINFVNLSDLRLGESAFFGSLKFLQKLTKLKELSINDTNINDGLEYLPVGLKKI